jgi:hypothetical protein
MLFIVVFEAKMYCHPESLKDETIVAIVINGSTMAAQVPTDGAD